MTAAVVPMGDGRRGGAGRPTVSRAGCAVIYGSDGKPLLLGALATVMRKTPHLRKGAVVVVQSVAVDVDGVWVSVFDPDAKKVRHLFARELRALPPQDPAS